MSIPECHKCTPAPEPPPLLTLPLELQFFFIIPRLSYPDALALKHTHPHFYDLIDTSVRMKVAWLLERKERGLEWPQKKCAMKTDALFCVDEVNDIMEKRKAHGECKSSEAGCEVVIGATCGGRERIDKGKVVQKLWRSRIGRPSAWLTMWIVGLLVMSLFANLYIFIKWYPVIGAKDAWARGRLPRDETY